MRQVCSTRQVFAPGECVSLTAASSSPPPLISIAIHPPWREGLRSLISKQLLFPYQIQERLTGVRWSGGDEMKAVCVSMYKTLFTEKVVLCPNCLWPIERCACSKPFHYLFKRLKAIASKKQSYLVTSIVRTADK
jgi:hypothetical protein